MRRLVKIQSVTGLSSRTLAVEGRHAVVTGAAVVARLSGAVVDVDAAVEVGPAVDADAEETSQLVDARAAVQTGSRQFTLVHVVRAVPTCDYHQR